MVYKEHLDELRSALALTDFEEVDFCGLADYPAEEYSHVQEALRGLASEREVLLARAIALAEQHYAEAVALDEALASRHRAAIVRSEFGSTESTFVVRGWLRAKTAGVLVSAMDCFEDIDLTFEDPGPDDEPPVALENHKLLRPFEVLTDLYGRPRYRDLDPTPLMAPFFFVFFGLCMGDVGYGIVLGIVAWLIKTKLDVAAGVKKFMDLLILGGLSSAIVGVFLGSYFSIEVEKLPDVLQKFAVVDPLNEIIIMLGFTVVLGIVHVLLGVGVQVYRKVRAGDVRGAIFDEASTLLLWVSMGAGAGLAIAGNAAGMGILFVGLGLSLLMKGRVFEAPLAVEDVPTWDKALGWVWVAACLLLLVGLAVPGQSWIAWVVIASAATAVVSKTARKGVMGLLVGAYGGFNTLTGLGDFLSYTRLAALGMASVLVGWVMNLLAGMMPMEGGAAVIGIFFAALILLVGHAFNIVINLLGAFVHPLRLQFVEFFGKFYEGGGKNHTPFGFGTKSLVLRRGTAHEEGGVGL